MGTVQSDELCATKSDLDDTDELEDSSDLQRDLERYERSKVLTVDHTITINLSDSGEPKEVKIGATLPEGEAKRLVQLLKDYQDIFAWSYADMPGLDPSIVEHSLPTNPDILPKKQRLRRTKPELSKKIEEEVMKLLKVGFIEVTQYPSWVANIVPVMKKDGRVRVCIDYRDLSKASPKDDFPLPHIDVLVDSTAGFELFSFMDAEYEACILGLQAAVEMGITKLKVFGDSALIILQTVREWKTRDTKLVLYHEYLEEIMEEFEDISFEYLSRSHNQFADALATLSSMLQVTGGIEVEPLKIEVLTKPAYCMVVTGEPDEKPWYYDIMSYIQKQKFPEGSTPADRKYIMKMASKFFVSGEKLYKRSYDSILPRFFSDRLGMPSGLTQAAN
ncbi:uncharacterized protein LOC115674822 [Syzygium oleosum]|uniref:uncharacterized protein LOC115674822 n=1 Tax=Syzygium oleosum TaxID=219896 RepID=UPI0024B96236|nr:uncharacterized protein LOC115674822 [Syzygium oleosum]